MDAFTGKTVNVYVADAGRPTALTEKMIEEVAEAVRVGNYLETAAAYCGVPREKLYEYLRVGAKAQAKVDEAEGDEVSLTVFEDRCKRFRHTLKKAQAQAEVSDVANVKRAGGKHWQASMTRLERMFPEKWGRRDRHDVRMSGVLGHAEVSDEEEREYRAAIAQFFRLDDPTEGAGGNGS